MKKYSKKLTVEQIMVFDPCYTQERVASLVGKGITLLDALDLKIPIEDRIWLAVRVLDKIDAVEFACQCAERVLPIWYEYAPNDHTPKAAIDAARGYMVGKVSFEALYAVTNAAWSASAANAANAANAAEGKAQIAILKKLIGEKE